MFSENLTIMEVTFICSWDSQGRDLNFYLISFFYSISYTGCQFISCLCLPVPLIPAGFLALLAYHFPTTSPNLKIDTVTVVSFCFQSKGMVYFTLVH